MADSSAPNAPITAWVQSPCFVCNRWFYQQVQSGDRVPMICRQCQEAKPKAEEAKS